MVPSARRKRARRATRGVPGARPVNAATVAPAPAPETRMTAMPPRPGALARAKMVLSKGGRGLGVGKLLVDFHHQSRDPLAID